MNSNILGKIAGNNTNSDDIISAATMTDVQKQNLEDLATAKNAVEGNKFSEEEIRRYMANMKTRPIVKNHKIGRNDPCPCGSNRKFKNCCINKPEYSEYHTI